MNIAVIKLKDLIKYTICFILIIAVIVIGISALKREEEFEEEVEETSASFFEGFKNSSFLYCLKMEVPLITIGETDISDKDNKDSASNKILSSELAIMHSLEEYGEEDDTELPEGVNPPSLDDIGENQEIKIAENDGKIDTQIIDDHNIKATYTNEGRSVQVNNQSGIDITDILNNSNYEIKNKNKFIIYHTHTCESYTSSEAYNYNMTGNYRTTDLNYTVSRVGDELEKNLKEYGKTVIHDKTYHDYPEYNGSYSRSLKTMNSILSNNKDTEIMIDLHRDAIRK